MSQTTSRLTNGLDTYTHAGTSSRGINFSTANVIALRTGGAGSCFGYVYFSKPMLAGSNILSATLKFYNKDAESGSKTVTLKKVTQNWNISKTVYNNAPTVTATDAKALTKSSPAANTEWAFDVTTHMQAVADGAQWFGWSLDLNSTDLMYFYSTQASGYKPVLEVVWTTAPDMPTQLSPAANRAVSVAKPILRFNFTDTSGSTTLQAIQVQINATNVWTSPTFDSGTVTTTAPQLDLSGTAYAGLTDGSSTYWRVRVQDGSSQWSPWSAGTQFKRVTKGTLVLDNPPVAGFSEPTPPVTWTLTGRTQKAYQVFVSDLAGNQVYDSSKIMSATASHTIGPNAIKHSGWSYVFTVLVWDNQDRETTPNDPTYLRVNRTVSYVYDAAVGGATGLTAVALTPRPGVQLAWSRASAPDKFVVWRDGKLLYYDVDPGDWNTGATTYAIKDPYADPKRAHSYVVTAVVNGATSSVNPAVNVTPDSNGIWLVDVARNIQVQLLDTESGDWSMREQSAVHSPIGGTKSVLITQALGGYEGSISGLITSHDSVDIDSVEADLWLLKSTPGQTYWLTASNITIPVVISNLEIAPMPDANLQKRVTFSFYQQGELPFEPTL